MEALIQGGRTIKVFKKLRRLYTCDLRAGMVITFRQKRFDRRRFKGWETKRGAVSRIEYHGKEVRVMLHGQGFVKQDSMHDIEVIGKE